MLTAQLLIDRGFTGKQVGETLKQSKNWTNEQVQHFLETGEKPASESVKMLEGSVWEFLCTDFFLNASKSEKRRWLMDGAVIINGRRPKPDDLVPPKITELILFPSSVLRTTML